MLKCTVKYGLLLVIMGCSLQTAGQTDPIFTQYMFNTQAVNPAYAGMWEKIGFFTLMRKQWTGIDRSPLTQMVSFHSPLKNEYVGVGLNVINDRFSREERLSIFGDYSFEILLSREMRLRLGLKFGFMNYQNPLTQYQLIDGEFDPAFQEDIDLKFLPNFGVGGFLYGEKYYLSLSIPKLIENKFATNRNNYSSLAEARHLYFSAGYVFNMSGYLKLKPTLMFRATMRSPVQLDLGGHIMLNDKLWLGGIFRSGDAICFVTQWFYNKNIRIGYAMDVTFNEIFRHQNGTYEFTLSYDVDFYGRSYVRAKYF